MVYNGFAGLGRGGVGAWDKDLAGRLWRPAGLLFQAGGAYGALRVHGFQFRVYGASLGPPA